MSAVPQGLREGAYAPRRDEDARSRPGSFSRPRSRASSPRSCSAISRAVGETMIVVLAAGSTPNLTFNPIESVQAMTAFIGDHRDGRHPRGHDRLRHDLRGRDRALRDDADHEHHQHPLRPQVPARCTSDAAASRPTDGARAPGDRRGASATTQPWSAASRARTWSELHVRGPAVPRDRPRPRRPRRAADPGVHQGRARTSASTCSPSSGSSDPATPGSGRRSLGSLMLMAGCDRADRPARDRRRDLPRGVRGPDAVVEPAASSSTSRTSPAVPSIIYGILGLAFIVRGPLDLGFDPDRRLADARRCSCCRS